MAGGVGIGIPLGTSLFYFSRQLHLRPLVTLATRVARGNHYRQAASECTHAPTNLILATRWLARRTLQAIHLGHSVSLPPIVVGPSLIARRCAYPSGFGARILMHHVRQHRPHKAAAADTRLPRYRD